MQTYQRPVELNATLTSVLSMVIPSLLEVVIVWNELEAQPPHDFISPHGIPVRFRVSKRNSLNEKLWPDPAYKTQALLLTDDDVYYHPKDLEFVFQSWRKYGRNKLVGALPRCSTLDEKNYWNYDFCSREVHQDVYSMILTNLCFSHISYLDYYSSDEPHMKDIRDYVDAGFNCEDIALNFIQGYLTGEGPLLVMGRDPYYNQSPHKGISTKIGHLDARSQCLNDFAKMFGRMTLVNSDGHITKGVVTM
ncbi:exostosin 2 [Dactylonectria macrodidyma]|uniref:Exostosin 2 n=1 Tax=Dactylonectria macrodidyma TaxID=307937 RepID=A0A9P9FE74_9HYPO|nr:exostosin 2 [Dactylonectria macrodidyma]